MALEELIGTVKLDYRWTLGEGFSRFFEGLKDKKILGSRCPTCSRVLVPTRKFCPRCYVDTTDVVEVMDRGIVTTFTVIYYSYPGELREPPYGVGIVRLDGADTDFIHYLIGIDFSDPKRVKELEDKVIGLRVRAVWSGERKGNIFDLQGFEPETPIE